VGLQMLQWHREHVEAMRVAQDTPAGDGTSPPLSSPIPPPPLILIHDIRHSGQRPYNNPAERARYKAMGVHMFDSYIDAAVIAFEAGLLSTRGLRYVIEQAAQEFKKVKFVSETQATARKEEYIRAIRRAHYAMSLSEGVHVPHFKY
jgi:hypothetical protein